MTTLQLKGRTAIVTGGASGIGRTIAEHLARLSCAVIIGDLRTDTKNVAAEIHSETRAKVIGIPVDVADFEACARFYSQAAAELKIDGVDILVNNAGITRDNLFSRMTFEQWDSVVRTDLYGVFNCTRAVVNGMIGRRYGRIVNVSSISALGNFGQTNYSAAKAGIIGFTKSLARELARFNITVNAICPGLIDTPMLRSIPESVMKSFFERMPTRRLGTTQEIANLVAFLVSPDASYVTGEAINASGGFFF